MMNMMMRIMRIIIIIITIKKSWLWLITMIFGYCVSWFYEIVYVYPILINCTVIILVLGNCIAFIGILINLYYGYPAVLISSIITLVLSIILRYFSIKYFNTDIYDIGDDIYNINFSSLLLFCIFLFGIITFKIFIKIKLENLPIPVGKVISSFIKNKKK